MCVSNCSVSVPTLELVYTMTDHDGILVSAMQSVNLYVHTTTEPGWL